MLRSSESPRTTNVTDLAHAGEEHGRLTGRVGTADDVDVGVDAVGGLGRRRAVEEAAAGRSPTRARRVRGGDARRDDHGVRGHLDAAPKAPPVPVRERAAR